MAKKKNSDLVNKFRFWHDMREETTGAIMAIFSFLITLLSLLAAFHKAGKVGEVIFGFFIRLFGVGYYLIPIVFAILGVAFVRGLGERPSASKIIGAGLFFVSALGLIDLLPSHAGGTIGHWITVPLLKLIDIWASTALLGAILISSIFMTMEIALTPEYIAFWKWGRKKIQKEAVSADMDEQEEAMVKQAVDNIKNNKNGEQNTKKQELGRRNSLIFSDDEERGFASSVVVPHLKPFTPPPLSLLERDHGKPETGDIKANANIIKRTLQNFGITVEMDEISIGPSVTRYALKPAEGVKLSRIVALNNDLALALAAHPIRIEAPIPGKSLVGIEVPNTAKTTVGLGTLLAVNEYKDSEKPLLVSLGKDIAGRAHFANLSKAPHMLIAGTTGSGKSVAIHSLVTSLLYRNSPESLKFIMIDPKRVELTMYNKIPHLLTPVITDSKKAILALKWAAKEMSRRYDILEKSSARDIDSYHKTILAPALETFKAKKKTAEMDSLPETMPYIVIVMDELADIMQAYPRELESAIVRLAQMSRAVGIHLVLSTQRPSVNVITGLIKANIPARVALQVASQIDSRTILDQTGAEKLLGAGDMLYLGGEMSKPVRLQSAFISETEVKSVVAHIVKEYKYEIADEINLTPSEAGSGAVFDALSDENSQIDDDDELYESAREAVMSAGKASTSYIQRKLGVGYSRAAKLMDMLEERGVIGPAQGSKPREVLGSSDSEPMPNNDESSLVTADRQ